MKKVAIMLAEGFEEIEAISVYDILKRAEINAILVGLDDLNVCGAHGLKISAEAMFDSVNFGDFAMIVLPGGLPGAENLAKSEKLAKILREFDAKNKPLAAICAAPWALGVAGVLKQSYTCYPGFEKVVAKDGYSAISDVITDKNITTSKGPATAMKFALEIVKILCGEQKFNEIKNGLLA